MSGMEQSLFTSFFQGALAGVLVTAPVGPICILCIQHSLERGRGSGIATGFGSAVALALYGTLGFAGVGILSHVHTAVRFSFLMVGAGILCMIGIRIFLSRPQSNPENISSDGLYKDALMTFFLELVNPASIMIFFGIFIAMQQKSMSVLGYASVALGIFLSSMIWWMFLATIVASFRQFFTSIRLLWLNRIAGIFIIFLGLRPFIALLLGH